MVIGMMVCAEASVPSDVKAALEALNDFNTEEDDPVFGNLPNEYFPENEFPKILELAKKAAQSKAAVVTEEQLKIAFKTLEIKASTATPEERTKARQFVQFRKFAYLNKKDIDHVLSAALGKAFDIMREKGQAPKGARVYFVAVPWPCPYKKETDATRDFLLTACKVAQDSGAKVIIASNMYGNPKGENKAEDDIATRKYVETYFKSFISSGVIKRIDSFANGHTTPWGFIVRDAVVVRSGNLLEWAESPAIILKELGKE